MRGEIVVLKSSTEIDALASRPWSEQLALGYGHTLQEVRQQPATWPETVATLRGRADDLRRCLEGVSAVILTGSGSSLYAGECAAPALQPVLHRPVAAVSAGQLLTHPETCLPPAGSCLVVSLARSGNSPESCAAVDGLLETRRDVRHLIITCNRDGALATSYRDRPNVVSVVLDEKTNDQSLVMTSSFTNLVLAARTLGALADPAGHEARTRALAQAASRVLGERGDALAAVGRREGRSAVFLGSGCRLGSAREAALKMLEMTAGEVFTQAESYLGLRHGPMSALREDTLIVAFLASDPMVRAYEVDVLRELQAKKLGTRRVVVGSDIPPELVPPGGVGVDSGAGLTDAELTVIDVLTGQLLAFFRCLASGSRPDSPSAEGVITRVVSAFAIHGREG